MGHPWLLLHAGESLRGAPAAPSQLVLGVEVSFERRHPGRDVLTAVAAGTGYFTPAGLKGFRVCSGGTLNAFRPLDASRGPAVCRQGGRETCAGEGGRKHASFPCCCCFSPQAAVPTSHQHSLFCPSGPWLARGWHKGRARMRGDSYPKFRGDVARK